VLQGDAKTIKVKDLALISSLKEKKVEFVKIYDVVDYATDIFFSDDDELSFLTNKFKKILTKHGN